MGKNRCVKNARALAVQLLLWAEKADDVDALDRRLEAAKVAEKSAHTVARAAVRELSSEQPGALEVVKRKIGCLRQQQGLTWSEAYNLAYAELGRETGFNPVAVNDDIRTSHIAKVVERGFLKHLSVAVSRLLTGGADV